MKKMFSGDKDLKNRIVRVLLFVCIFCLPGLGLIGCIKQKVYKIGILAGLESLTEISDGLKTAMTDLGYIEGENITYDIQVTAVDVDAYRNVVTKFLEDEVDVIFSFPAEATIEAKKVAWEAHIPVVFSYALIEGKGIVDSIQEPGGNITGVRYPGPDIAAKRFEIMLEFVPGAKKIYIPYQKGYPAVYPQLKAIRSLAKEAGVTILEVPAANAEEIKWFLAGRKRLGGPGIDAILGIAGPLMAVPDNFTVLAEFAYKHKIPIGGIMLMVGKYNALFGLDADIITSGKEAAPLVDNILKGIEAGTIPVVSSELFLEIHTGAAEILGITVPEELLEQAAKVYP